MPILGDSSAVDAAPARVTRLSVLSLFRLLGLLAIVAFAVWRSHAGTQLDSLTVDEPWHVVAGTAYIRNGDFQLNPEHPPLVKLWVGAAMPAEFHLRSTPVLDGKAQERRFVEATFFADNAIEPAQARVRAAMWSFHALLLVALGLLLWRASGWPWAVGTLAFLALEPTFAAHLPVAMTDAPLSLTLLVAVVAAGLLASRWQWRWVVPFGMTAGLALAAKHSALAGIGGIAAALLIIAIVGARHSGVRVLMRRGGQLAVAGMLALFVLWACYGLRHHAGADGTDGFNHPLEDKIAEVSLPHWRAALSFADRVHLLPRAYLWGLADTVRTGVEGRGITVHRIWGHEFEGRAPWFAWPAIVLAKVPLGLLALALLGGVLCWRARLAATARAVLVLAFAAGVFHMLALIGSNGVWGGVRHALPFIGLLAIPAGAAVAVAWQRRARALGAGVAMLFLATAAMTLGEPRVWEYHNEFVGGTGEAYRAFDNEGIDLGQRYAEIRAFHDREIVPSGLPLYSEYWMPGADVLRTRGLRLRLRVEDLDDNNIEGRWEGWFIYPMVETLPQPR